MAEQLLDASNAAPVRFNEDIVILPGDPRPHLAKQFVSVYTAQGTGKAPADLVAYVCDSAVSPRIAKGSNYGGMVSPHLMRLVAGGPAVWVAERKRKFCFIYEDMTTAPLMTHDSEAVGGMKPDFVINNVLKPMITVFYDFRNTDFVHGSIRPDNMYATHTGTALEGFTLGDCLTLPPSYDQPALYETIERAMAQPSGRGPGSMQSDLYALGATLAVLMRHTDPLAGMNPDDIIRAKHDQGSFTALFGKENLNGHHVDMLRGLLQDDPAQRWTLDELESWIEGRRPPPKTGARKKRAGRPLVIGDHKYSSPELLAFDIFKHPSETARLIDNGEFEQWLIRSLEDSPTITRVNQLKSFVEESGSKETREKRLLSCISMALHPEAPLRYDALAIMPQGFGSAFSEAAAKKQNLRPFLDLIQSKLVVQWLEIQEIGTIDISSIFTRFDACRNYLGQTTPGFGYERCLYEMDPECACMGEKIWPYYARSPEDILFALEELVKGSGKPLRLFDRHIIAFLMTRDRKNIEPYLMDINASVGHKKLLGELRTLATLQKRTRSAATPALAKWFADQGEVFVSRVHDRDERRKLEASMNSTAASGDLDRLLMLVDNPQMKRRDIALFLQAMREYQASEKEANGLRHELDNNVMFGRGAGRGAAAALSSLIAFVIIGVTIFRFMSQGGVQGMF